MHDNLLDRLINCVPRRLRFVPDYVYNPKEARIRKAMREATRDRSIGASPMLPRPSARRAATQGWTAAHEEQLMMVSSTLRCDVDGSAVGIPICLRVPSSQMGLDLTHARTHGQDNWGGYGGDGKWIWNRDNNIDVMGQIFFFINFVFLCPLQYLFTSNCIVYYDRSELNDFYIIWTFKKVQKCQFVEKNKNYSLYSVAQRKGYNPIYSSPGRFLKKRGLGHFSLPKFNNTEWFKRNILPYFSFLKWKVLVVYTFLFYMKFL